MEKRISLITLGVSDIEAAAAAFREALGWGRVPSPEGVIAFDLIDQTPALYPLDDLARDKGLPNGDLGHGAITLVCNVRIKSEVAEAGATVLKAAQDTFWGGHAGYFRALDRAIWEVTFNPFAPLSREGAFRWNCYG
jgi:hypothetical protein